MGLFSGAKQVAAQLRQLARKNGAQVAAPELLRRDMRHKDAPGLAALTELLETGSQKLVFIAMSRRFFPAARRMVGPKDAPKAPQAFSTMSMMACAPLPLELAMA